MIYVQARKRVISDTRTQRGTITKQLLLPIVPRIGDFVNRLQVTGVDVSDGSPDVVVTLENEFIPDADFSTVIKAYLKLEWEWHPTSAPN